MINKDYFDLGFFNNWNINEKFISDYSQKAVYQNYRTTRTQDGRMKLIIDLPGIDPATIKVEQENGSVIISATTPENKTITNRYTIGKEYDAAPIACEAKFGQLIMTFLPRVRPQKKQFQVKF